MADRRTVVRNIFKPLQAHVFRNPEGLQARADTVVLTGKIMVSDP